MIQNTKKVEVQDYTSLFFPTKRQSNHGYTLNILNAQIEFVRNKRLKCMCIVHWNSSLILWAVSQPRSTLGHRRKFSSKTYDNDQDFLNGSIRNLGF